MRRNAQKPAVTVELRSPWESVIANLPDLPPQILCERVDLLHDPVPGSSLVRFRDGAEISRLTLSSSGAWEPR